MQRPVDQGDAETSRLASDVCSRKNEKESSLGLLIIGRACEVAGQQEPFCSSLHVVAILRSGLARSVGFDGDLAAWTQAVAVVAPFPYVTGHRNAAKF